LEGGDDLLGCVREVNWFSVIFTCQYISLAQAISAVAYIEALTSKHANKTTRDDGISICCAVAV